jgi:hypothetical protein
MLHTNELKLRLGAEAVSTAAYLMNRIPNRKETTITPYEQWHGIKPELGHLRIFGSIAYAHIPHQLRRKEQEGWSSSLDMEKATNCSGPSTPTKEK